VNLQFVIDGLVMGAMIGLGAIGVTLTYAILGFANFAHGEFMAWGAYIALALAAMIGAVVGDTSSTFASLSFGWSIALAAVIAAVLTGGLAMALDFCLFSRLRNRGNAIVMVIASFGASLALRNLLEFLFTSQPAYFSRKIQMAMTVAAGIRITPDQLFLLAFTIVLFVLVDSFMVHSTSGRAMRAVAENPTLAKISGVNVDKVIKATWLLGGALASMAGIMLGLTVQIRPYMGFDLLLPLFAAAILGGIGSVRGAVAGGLIVGISEALAVQLVGADYRAAIAFLMLVGVLMFRPTGLFGARA